MMLTFRLTDQNKFDKTRTEWFEAYNEQKGERIQVRFTYCNNSSSLHEIWYKKGYTDKLLNSHISCEVFVEKGEETRSDYNPTYKKQIDVEQVITKDGAVPKEWTRLVLNFDWVLEVSLENRNKLLHEIARLAEEG